MRFQSGRWAVVLAAAVVVPSFFLAGCKSGTNLVSLPKMPRVDLVTWGKKKPSDADVSKNEASQLPPPPSAAAFAGQSGTNNPYGTPRYPNTGRAPVQPAGAPYSPDTYPQSAPAGGGLAYGPGNAADPYYPAYTRPSESPNYGGSAGSYGGASPAYERTASRSNPYGGPTYGGPAPTNDGRYEGSQYNGGQYDDSRAEPNRATQPSSGSYPSSSPYSSRQEGGYSRPAGFESAGGNGTAPGGYMDSAYDRRTPAGEPGYAATPYGQPAGRSGMPDYQDGPVCSGDSCTAPGSAAPISSGAATRTPRYRPGNTGDLDRQQWVPSSTATRSQPSSYSSGASPTVVGNDPLARQTGYETEGSRPRGESYPASGAGDYSPQVERDSSFGTRQY